MALLGLGITGLIFMVSVRVFRLQALFLSGMTAFVAWVGLSVLWTESIPGSVREFERDVIYVALAFALAVFGRYLSARGLALGLLAGIASVAAYALTTRLFPTHFAAPDPIAAYQLSVPLGYWNALGLLAAMGMVLALGVAGHANVRVIRMAAGPAMCVIAPAMLFTFSRGAWVAAAIGLVAMFVLDSHRIALAAAAAAIAVPVGCLVWLGMISRPLTDAQATVAEAAQSGRRYALAVILLACLSVVLVDLAQYGLGRAQGTVKIDLTIHIVSCLKIVLNGVYAGCGEIQVIVALVYFNRFNDPFEIIDAVFRPGHQAVAKQIVHPVDI